MYNLNVRKVFVLTFGERLRNHRKQNKLTQEQLAKEIGVAKPTIAGYERNSREPDLPKIINIAKALGVSVDELLGISVTDVPTSKTQQSGHANNQEPEQKENPPPGSQETDDQKEFMDDLREFMEVFMELPKHERETMKKILRSLAGK